MSGNFLAGYKHFMGSAINFITAKVSLFTGNPAILATTLPVFSIAVDTSRGVLFAFHDIDDIIFKANLSSINETAVISTGKIELDSLCTVLAIISPLYYLIILLSAAPQYLKRSVELYNSE